jgi:hypothetical protein
MSTTTTAVLYAIMSGVALMAIPLITCILGLLILRRVDALTASLVGIGLALDGKLERLIAAREIIAHALGVTEGQNQSKR